jgi:hypothetical protein
MNVKLSVLPTLTKKQKKLREKENGWVLDCNSEEKVRLKPYNFAAETFEKYFVIRTPKKKKTKEELINSAKFRTFLLNEKCKILKIQNSLSAVSSK